MIITDARKILENHLGAQSITVIDEKRGIFKCSREYDHNPYQILYVDCSNIWFQDGFGKKELESYQEQTLQKQYYGNAGPLQWNYYYAFISEPKQIKAKIDKKKEIESDELYTRKLVLSPKELDEWLQRIQTLAKPSQTIVEKDLGSVWAKKLQNAKLDAVFSDVHITDGVRKYMNGAPIVTKVFKEKNGKGKGDDPEILSIDHIKLEKFRDYPLQREFDFKKVNLIKGVNGTGKTSLMESIELLLCGQSFRNRDQVTSHFIIKAEINGRKTPLSFSPGNIKLFKSRDKSWYNSGDHKLNRLPNGFNKYNFYNSDAAYLLSHESDQWDVKKAFEDIALGEDINRIEGRMINFRDSFNKQFLLYSKLVKELGKEKSKEEALLKELSTQNQDPEEFFQLLIKETKKMGLKNPAKYPSTSKLEKDITTAKTYLQSVTDILSWTHANTFDSISKLHEDYSKALKSILESEKLIQDNDNVIEDKTSELETLELISDTLKDLSPYFTESRIKELIGLENKIITATSEVATIKKLQQIIEQVNLETLRALPANTRLKPYSVKLSNDVSKKENQIQGITSTIRSLTAGMDQMDTLISEIKVKGRQYLKLNTEAIECPLCQTPYPYDQLLKLISQTKSTIKSTAILQTSQTELQIAQNDLKILKTHQKNFAKFRESISYLPEFHNTEVSINVLVKTIYDLIASFPSKEESLKKFDESKKYFAKKGLKETEFSALLESLEDYDIKLIDSKDFLSKEKKNRSQTENLKNDLKQLATLSIKAKSDIKLQLAKLNLLEKNRKELQPRIEKLENALRALSSFKEIFTIKGSDNIFSYEMAIKNLEQLLGQYKQAKQEKQEHQVRLKTANNRFEELSKKVAENAKLEKRALKAISDIDEIMKTDNKSEYLKKFIDVNKSEIVEIFKMIHTPQEFEDLGFGDEKELLIKRTGASHPESLKEISAGQRAALALSVFSALNRKLKNGPQILMFDDPVVNVDDMNILSYLDYLREVSINGNRQIFFATANDNLAFLFTQKFSFLKDDFVPIELSR